MIRRSRFIAGCAGMLAVPLAPLSRASAETDTVSVHLTAARHAFSPASGLRVEGLAFNGSIPGPVLRVRYGQRLRATLVNRTGISTTIHWHGMILPNAMDGVENVTQAPVRDGESFTYEFTPGPPGTRWYHDHIGEGMYRGLFGMFIVDDPHETPADAEFALVFHDVPRQRSIVAAQRGLSTASSFDPARAAMQMGDASSGMAGTRDNAMRAMGDEIAYAAHCINGASYPNTAPLQVTVGQRVRLRILNAGFTQTRYVRLAGHRLTVSHADGNALERPVEADVLRVGVAERYDAWFTVTKPGAWRLYAISEDPLAYQQSTVVHTEGMRDAPARSTVNELSDLDVLRYETAGAATSGRWESSGKPTILTLAGGGWGNPKWTINGAIYPATPPINVRAGDRVAVRFVNKSEMEHPMHLHGHTFRLVEVDGRRLVRPLRKDTAIVAGNGGTMTWEVVADSPPGRWLLHCHNSIHMSGGMATELRYV